MHPGAGGPLRSEEGIALALVLFLSFICLAIVATLIFLVTQGTRFSGFNKRYETAREASYGGTEVIRALISKQGDLSTLQSFLPSLKSTSTLSPDTFKQCDCGDISSPDNITINTVSPKSCLCLKLCSPTLNSNGTDKWTLNGCDHSLLDPTDSYDLKFQLAGFGTSYDVFAKIVDTSLGNTDMSGLNLGGTAVVASVGSITPPQAPYLYTLEITGQDVNYAAQPGLKERGRLSVLYAY